MPATVRKNDGLLRYISAVALAVVAWVALRGMPFYPDWLELLLAAGVGVLAVLSPATATLLFVGVLSIPLIAANFIAGMFILIVGLVATQYLSMGRAGAFVLAAVGVAAIPLHAPWAAVAAAGYLLGRTRGAAAGAAIAVTAVVLGVALGVPVTGVVATGAGSPLLSSISTPPPDPLAFGWVLPALKSADAAAFLRALVAIEWPVLVLAQVALWAVAGAAASFARRSRPPLALGAVAAVVAGLALGHIVLDAVFSGPVGLAEPLVSLALSLPFALGLTAAAIWAFPVVKAGPRVAVPAGERDVDELLRVIASAEDELASRHNTEAVVLITDMKSFSAMTEELGSVEAAKVVQRHRDLLLPILAAHKGNGAATGGDGLVACFRAPADAVAAAIEMQRVLEGYTGSDRSPHELSVRIGIASGEVVVDAAGVPFLGAALNLAARVMDLADGGRIMITSYISSAAGLEPEQLHRHGDFKLKNIAEPIPVAEVLWKDGMTEQEIRAV